MTSSPTIYHHPNPLSSLPPHLTSHLPRSLPLLRRLQFHFQSRHAHVFATFPADSPPSKTQIWSAAFTDRSRAPETECWIFTSWEPDTVEHDDNLAETNTTTHDSSGQHTAGLDVTVNAPSNGIAAGGLDIDKLVTDGLVTDGLANDGPATDRLALARAQLLSLLATIRAQTQHPTNPHTDPNAIMIGAVHEHATALLSSVVKSRSEPWLTFLYCVRYPSSASVSDGEGEALLSSLDLCWSTVVPAEFALVRSRTAIPRSDSTLGLLASVGVRDRIEGKLLAWAFLGVDGSLASLHVEPEMRGKGLGRLVAKRVLDLLWKDEVFEVLDVERAQAWRWGFSHAGVENAGSIAVAKALGGRLGWTDYWITVDLEAC